MRSALDQLHRIPAADVAALRKMRDGELPPPQPLASPAVLVVDMVEAFVRDRYPTGWAATGAPCATEIAGLLTVARGAGAPVIYTTTTRLDHPALVGEWRRGETGKQVPPFVLDPPAHEVAAEIAPVPGDIVLSKAKPSAFYGTQLAGVLHALGAHSLVITGMTTSGCIRATVLDAFNLNYHSVVPMSCVADRSGLSHEVNLFDIGAKYGDIVTTGSLLDELAGVRL